MVLYGSHVADKKESGTSAIYNLGVSSGEACEWVYQHVLVRNSTSHCVHSTRQYITDYIVV